MKASGATLSQAVYGRGAQYNSRRHLTSCTARFHNQSVKPKQTTSFMSDFA